MARLHPALCAKSPADLTARFHRRISLDRQNDLDLSGRRGLLESEIGEETSPASWCKTPDLLGPFARSAATLAEACHAKAGALARGRGDRGAVARCRRPAARAIWGRISSWRKGSLIGNPMNFGGPHVGLFATRQTSTSGRCRGGCAARRSMWTASGAIVLTLSTREQHIRREKATSNICTNAGLCALAFSPSI